MEGFPCRSSRADSGDAEGDERWIPETENSPDANGGLNRSVMRNGRECTRRAKEREQIKDANVDLSDNAHEESIWFILHLLIKAD